MPHPPKIITLDRKRLVAGDLAWCVDGEYMPGWHCTRGVVFCKTSDGHAWMEFHGDDENFYESGDTYVSYTDSSTRVMFNMLPSEHLYRLTTDPLLHIGAVNRGKVIANRTACTVYNSLGGMLVPSYRFEGLVTSATMNPPILTHPEPLNAWIETRDRVEIL